MALFPYVTNSCCLVARGTSDRSGDWRPAGREATLGRLGAVSRQLATAPLRWPIMSSPAIDCATGDRDGEADGLRGLVWSPITGVTTWLPVRLDIESLTLEPRHR